MGGNAGREQDLSPSRRRPVDGGGAAIQADGLEPFRAQSEQRHERVAMPGAQFPTSDLYDGVGSHDVHPDEVRVGREAVAPRREGAGPGQLRGHDGGLAASAGVLARARQPLQSRLLRLGQTPDHSTPGIPALVDE